MPITYQPIITKNMISICAINTESATPIPIGVADSTRYKQKQNIWYLNRLYVNPEHRGNHVASKLLNQLLDIITDKQATLWLEINPYGNLTYEQLEAFYQRHGFRKHDRQHPYYEYKAEALPTTDDGTQNT